jgi:hypothetical protein
VKSHISKLVSAVLATVALCAATSVAKGGTLTVYMSPPAAQSSTVSGITTETFDSLSTGVKTSAYSSAIGTYTGSSSNPFAILANNVYGGATDSTHTSPTNYFAVGSASSSTAPVTVSLTHPAAYFGFWWSAGDASNRVDLYQGTTLYASFSTQDLLNFLNNGVGTVTALNGSTKYNTSAYYGNPNLTSGSNDSGEPFVYISFAITGTTVDTIKFYNTGTASSFESDNHSYIQSGNTVTIPTTFVQVETINLTPTTATPTFNPLPGTYTSVQSVAISTTTSGASIRYTTDGSTPSETAGTLYSSAVSVGVTETLKAIAYKSGLADSAIASGAYTINLPAVATPAFSPAAGTYTSVQSVAISTTTSGASIRYTTDGSTPSETAGTLYSGAVSVGVTETLKAIAYKSGMSDSAVASAAYTINLPVVATPTFSPSAGTYTGTQSVTISTTTSGASIRYTTDGSTPSETAGTLYSGAVSVGATDTLKAIAYKSGMTDSSIASAAYTIVTATPTFSPGAGTYTSVQSVTISTATSGASIRYTTDGSTPSETAGTLYSGAVSVGATETLKAIAYKTGLSDSSIASAAYTINLPAVATPTFSPAAGTYTSVQSVTISTTTSGASIRYTTDGSTPSETAGTLYSGAVSVGVTETLKAIAYKSGMSDSAIGSAAYTINLPVVAIPTFNPVAGTYTTTQTVTIATTTSGATIRYTTDGSTPSETVGTVYSTPVSVSTNETLKALAYKTGMTDSAIGTAAYTIAPVVATPTFNPTAGTYTTTQTVTIATTTSGATIRYTTDGSTPSETVGTVYSSPVSVSTNETLNAIAYKTGMTDSAIGTAAYTIAPIVAMPTFNPTAGTYTTTQTVTIATTTSGATIRYTTDGSTPTETVGTVYSSPVSVSTNETLKAIAYKTGMTDSTIGTAVYAIAVATPTFNPTAGSYATAQTVTIATTTSGATIRYTTDGSTPSETAGTVYSAPVSVSTNETINAIAYKTGLTDSAIGNAVYAIAVATPTFNPTAGSYTTGQTVTVATTTAGATIRYTTDGSTPSETVGTVYSAPVSVSTNETLKAIAYKTGLTDSGIGSAVYVIAVATPTFNPPAGSYATTQTVTIATTTSGATIRFTTDGSTPSETVGTVYSGPVTVSTNETLKAIAYKTGMADSAVAPAAYVMAVAPPTFNPPAGNYTATQTVTIATTTSGATIRYTTDGSTPSETVGTLYSSPVSVSKNQTINAIAYETGMTDSAVPSAAYTIAPPVVTPTFSPAAGTYTTTQTVTISTTTSGASIRYTTDGSTPSETAGTLYSGPISVNVNETIKAIAYASGMSDSALASAAYNVPISVTLAPAPATLSGGQNQQFTATVFNSGNTAVTWATTPAGIGSVSGTGLYSAPTSVSSTRVLTVTATSVADTTKSATAVLGLTPAGTVWISPQAVTLSASQTQQFSAGAAYTNSSVTWTISPTGLGTIDNTGFYTAPSCIFGTQTVTVTATSSANPSVSTSATVTLLNANGYSFARAITIDHTKVPNTDQTNFPFLFNTTDPAFATIANGGHVTNANGYDLIFSTDPAGLTKLDHELEKYNPATGQVIAWVRVPTLSHTSDTVLYVFYGNSTISSTQENKTGVWDSNFEAVWHLPNGTALTANDSTMNGNNASSLNGTSAAAGMIGGGGNFNGTGNFLLVPNSASLNNWSQQTISLWVNAQTDMGSNTRLIEKGANNEWTLLFNSGGSQKLSVDLGTSALALTSTGAVADTTWHKIDVTMDNNSQAVAIYVDGALNASGIAPAYASATNNDISIGQYGGGGYYYHGLIDEVKISNTIRPADWIAAEYKNQWSPATFYTLAAEARVSLSISPLSISLFASQSQQFSTGQSSSCGSGVTWSLSPTGIGTIDATGLYTAPATVATQQNVTVTAMSASGAGGETATATVILLQPITITPTTATLSAGQTQQLTAVANGSVTWSINPSSAGSISSSGLYTAPPCVTTQQTVTVTATTGAGQNASATITLLAGSPFGYHRIIVIDHTKVANTDQANFPFLFSTTDPAFANAANGGHVTNPNGYDIIFSTDPNGLTTLNFEMQQYNPATGQVIAWVRIPTLSHTSDTVLYVFCGNAGITTSQANPTAVWDSNFKGVWHFSTPTTLSALDSTANANNGNIMGSPSVIPGQIGWAADFAGNNDALAIPRIPLAGVNYTISAWFNMPFSHTGESWNTLTRGVNSDWQVIVDQGNWHLGSYGNQFFDSGFDMSTLSAGWHHLVADAQQGTTTFYVDAAPVGSVPFQSVSQISLLGNYQSDGQQFGGTDEIRISTGIARSPDWITTEFNNQSSPSTFYALSSEGAAVSLAPAAITLYASQTEQFAGAVLANCNQGLTWTINPANAGMISASGLYTAPASVATQQAVTVTATSLANSANSASTTVTLYPPETVTVSPSAVPIYGRQTQQFTTSFTNALSTAVTWSVSPTGFGGISATGLYTAPTTITTQQTLTVTATSQQNSSFTATATITLYPPVAVGLSPTTAILYGGQTQQFTASVADTINPAVTWSLNPTGVGSITPGGLYSAPASVTGVQPITVTATSVTDPTKFASVTLNLAPQGTVLVFPTTVTLLPAQTQQFSAEVANSNTAVTWSISPPALGTISSTGLYTAPATNCDQQTVTITATSVANPSFSGTATVILSNANGYSYQRAITIDHTKVPNTDQTNFPVLISGTYPFLATISNGGHVVNPNGYDIVFALDATCVTKLSFEVEQWNPQTGQLISWVQIPTLSHSADTIIYACYGNSSVATPQANPSNTWDGTFEAVWHFSDGNVVSAPDSTVNANNANSLSTVSAIPGKIYGALSFTHSTSLTFAPSPSLGACPSNARTA